MHSAFGTVSKWISSGHTVQRNSTSCIEPDRLEKPNIGNAVYTKEQVPVCAKQNRSMQVIAVSFREKQFTVTAINIII